ncbi:uncharacterized protein EMH_0001170 [Eimeria mitis]|uniref:Uncharacterized protein n=1 Tax=Eimeria mitis TaxID=44415 RepID=U6JSK9_9EIME|nr:uncharacterized protein EMH_0001170 [Eimeria mitis]CDJ28389.1 hypothetical protein, conserved [Eimeria mitis]
MGRHRTHVTETIQGPPNSRSVLLAGAQSVLETTAARIRNEVASLDGDLLEEKLLLLQQLDHLEATLSLLERILPLGSTGDVKELPPEELCEACRHLNMAVHTMLALAPKFREATSHRLVKQLGSGTTSIFDCFSRRRPPVELSPEKRKSRIRVQLDKLEKQHEDCLLDLLLSFEHLTTAEVIPPPDAPPRCAEGSRYVLSGQAKLHQSHAMVCQLLLEEDDLLLPILEWQLGAAASDFAVARAVLDRLPRPQEPANPSVSSRKAYESPTIYSDCSYACGSIRASSPSCSSLPNLGALGPCDLCNSGANLTQLQTPASDRYTYMASDGAGRNESDKSSRNLSLGDAQLPMREPSETERVIKSANPALSPVNYNAFLPRSKEHLVSLPHVGLTRGDLTTVRLRTKNGLEIITCQIASGYSLIAIQNCTDKPYISGDAAQTAASDGQEAERDG